MANNSNEWVDLPLDEPTRSPASKDEWVDLPIDSEEPVKAQAQDEWVDVPSDADRGIVGQTLDATKENVQANKEVLGQGFEWAKEKLKNAKDGLYDMAGPLVTNAVVDTVELPFKALGAVFNASDKLLGNVVATVADPLARGLDEILAVPPEQRQSLRESAIKRQIENGTIKDRQELSLNKIMPVSFVEDVAFPFGQTIVAGSGKELQAIGEKLGSKNLKETGEFLEYMGPAAGLASAVILSGKFDPLMMTRFGTLTEAGKKLEKTDSLSAGLARQIQNKERSIAEFRFGDKTLGRTNFGKVGSKVIEDATNLAIMAESSAPVRIARKFTTFSPLRAVNDAAEDLSLLRNGSEFETQKFVRSTFAKADALGLDLADDAIKKDLRAFADNPSSYKGTTPKNKLKTFIDDHLNAQLKAEVEATRASGGRVPEKIYYTKEQYRADLAEQLKSIDEDYRSVVDKTAKKELSFKKSALQKELNSINEGKFSERYAPRSPSAEKLVEYRKKKFLKEANGEEALSLADEVLEEIDGAANTLLADYQGKKSGQGLGRFGKKRSFQNTESMNKYMEENFRIKDFFHDDITVAYAETINDLRRTRIEADYVRKLTKEFGMSEVEWAKKKLKATERSALSQMSGKAADPQDLLMARMADDDFVRFKELPTPVRDRLQSLSRVYKDLDGIEDMVLPGMVADYATEQLVKANIKPWQAKWMGFMNTLKAGMFFSPGFHIRNSWESGVRSFALDVSLAENANAFRAMVKGTGPYAERIEDWNRLNKGMSFLTESEVLKTPIQKAKDAIKVKIDREMLAGDSPLKKFQNALREMAATGQDKAFLSDLRKNPVSGSLTAIRDNPLFKFSANVGQKAENIPKFAYFNKLIDQGYSAETAMKKVNRAFMNYEMTRQGTRTLQLAAPFANYAIKNAETTLKMLAQRPGAGALFGPQGNFQRAIEHWAGWNTNAVQEMKDMMGSSWSSDQIYLPIIPGHEDIKEHKDLLRSIYYKIWGDAPPGSVGTIRLPSNFHALSMWDPTKLDEMKGPLINAAVALYGTDPFTGKEIIGKGTDPQNWERIKVAAKQLSEPLIPRTALTIGRAAMEKMHEAWVDNLSKLGMSEPAAKIMLDSPEAERAQKKIAKSLVKVKTMWLGGYTELVQDMTFRIMAKLNKLKAYKSAYKVEEKTGRRTEESDRAQFLKLYESTANEIEKMINIKDGYEERLTEIDAPVFDVDYQDDHGGFEKPEPEEPVEVDGPINREPQGIFDAISNALIPEAGAATYSEKSGEYTPGKSKMFGRGSVLTKNNIEPTVQELEPGDPGFDGETEYSDKDRDRYLPEYKDIEDGKVDPEELSKKISSQLEGMVSSRRLHKRQKALDLSLSAKEQGSPSDFNDRYNNLYNEELNKLSPAKRREYDLLLRKLSLLGDLYD